jgi:hypothetical protein
LTDRDDAARAVLRRNDRGGFTVPNGRVYPFQWNWDSAFVALGFATFDLDRAWRELETLFEGQWQDGMVPHIVFRAPAEGYYPGPEAWGIQRQPLTSGISQPPRGLASRRRRARALDRPGRAGLRVAALLARSGLGRGQLDDRCGGCAKRGARPRRLKLVETDTRRLIGDAGFSEYFDPTNGDGIGGKTFSWTAAIDLLLGERAAA